MKHSRAVVQAPADDVRARILAAAAALIAGGGRDAATTRAVAAAAGVQAPAIYRLFTDKRGLLEAVVEHTFGAYVASKAGRKRRGDADPVRALRDGWDMHVAFGLAHPGLFAILSGDPDVGTRAVAAGREMLQSKVSDVARSGRLRVSEERAVALLQSACIGVVLTLLGESEENRDHGLSEASREAVLAAITGESTMKTAHTPHAVASALRAALDQTSVLTSGERMLLVELLARIANG
jgi:AcrR family transcriptional regulator